MGFPCGQQRSQPAKTVSGFGRKATCNPQLHLVPFVMPNLNRLTMRQFLIILTVFLINACGQTSNKRENGPRLNQDTIELKKANSTRSETEDFISTSCAIIISPTDQKIDSMKKADGDDFYTVADDNLFYLATARQYLDSTKTKTIQKEAKGSVKFKLKNGEIIDKNLSEYYWKILLFNGQAKPIEADITDFNSVFDRYMKTKK